MRETPIKTEENFGFSRDFKKRGVPYGGIFLGGMVSFVIITLVGLSQFFKKLEKEFTQNKSQSVHLKHEFAIIPMGRSQKTRFNKVKRKQVHNSSSISGIGPEGKDYCRKVLRKSYWGESWTELKRCSLFYQNKSHLDRESLSILLEISRAFYLRAYALKGNDEHKAQHWVDVTIDLIESFRSYPEIEDVFIRTKELLH